MISRCVFLLLLLFPSSCFAYIFDVNWREYTTTTNNYGRSSLVAVNVWLAICRDQNVVLNVSDQDILNSAGYMGDVTATFNGNTIEFNYPYSNYNINKRIILWPMVQEGNVVRCAFYFLSFGLLRGTSIPGVESVGGNHEGFIWTSCGVVDITNFFTGAISCTIVNHDNYFPFDIRSGAIDWMDPSVRSITLNYDTVYNNISLGKVQPGGVAEVRNLFSTNFETALKLAITHNVVHDFLTWSYYDFGSSVAPFSLLMNTGNNNFYPALMTIDTDGGSEPDLHEFFTLHLYQYPQDDWTYSGDYPSGGGSGGSGGGDVGGGGGGGAGELVEIGPDAQEQITDSVSDALDDYFGSQNGIDIDYLQDDDLDDERDDVELDDDFLETARNGDVSNGGSGVESALPAGVSKLQTIINTLKNSDSSPLPSFSVPLEMDFTGIGLGKIWSNFSFDIDFSFLEDDPWDDYFLIFRKLVVLVLYGSLVIYILKDQLFLGDNNAAAGGD